MPISLEVEKKILFSLEIRESFNIQERNDLKRLFPEIAAKAAPIRKKIMSNKTDKPFEILPGELNPDIIDDEVDFFELGKMYYSGKGRPKDIKKAIFYFHFFNKKNENSEVIYQLAQIYAKGHGPVLPINMRRSSWLLSAITGGRKYKNIFDTKFEVSAALMLSNMLLSNVSLVMTQEDEDYFDHHCYVNEFNTFFEDYSELSRVERNKSAIKLLKIAALSGSSEASFLLGKIFETGSIVKKNVRIAASYYLKAKEAGDREGSSNFLRLIAQHKKETEEKAQSIYTKRDRNENNQNDSDDDFLLKPKKSKISYQPAKKDDESGLNKLQQSGSGIEKIVDEKLSIVVKNPTASLASIVTQPAVPLFSSALSASVSGYAASGEGMKKKARIPKKQNLSQNEMPIPALPTKFFSTAAGSNDASSSSATTIIPKKDEVKEGKEEEHLSYLSMLKSANELQTEKFENKKKCSSSSISSEPASSLGTREFVPGVPHSASMDYSKHKVNFFHPRQQREYNKQHGKFADRDKEVASPKGLSFSDNALHDIGHYGEKHIYEILKAHYLQKFKPTEFVENDTGFTLTSREKDVRIAVKWYDKLNQRVIYPRDLKLTIVRISDGSILKKRYIEVKSTTSPRDHVAHFSGDEFEQMRKFRNKYTLFRVSNVEKAERIGDIHIEKIKDPLQKIIDGELSIDKFTLAI